MKKVARTITASLMACGLALSLTPAQAAETDYIASGTCTQSGGVLSVNLNFQWNSADLDPASIVIGNQNGSGFFTFRLTRTMKVANWVTYSGTFANSATALDPWYIIRNRSSRFYVNGSNLQSDYPNAYIVCATS